MRDVIRTKERYRAVSTRRLFHLDVSLADDPALTSEKDFTPDTTTIFRDASGLSVSLRSTL
jgi:hypothetical protein